MNEGALGDLFIATLARELHDADRLFVGANQNDVALAAHLARRLWAPRLKFWASSTAHLDRSQDLLRVGRGTLDPVLVAGRDSTFWQAHAFDDALRAPLVFAGGLQVDARGNANLAGIRGGSGWKLRGPGSAGLPSLTALANRFFIMVPVHDPRVLVAECSALSVVGDPVARAAAGLPANALVAVLTPLARFEPSDQGLVLTEVAPGLTVEAVAERTGWPVRSGQVRERAPLTEPEVSALAELRAAAERNREALWRGPRNPTAKRRADEIDRRPGAVV
jgi:acyl CoA:acetate/3-ketoacid CoA transferase beta subunit